jgi:hypothetical protein
MASQGGSVLPLADWKVLYLHLSALKMGTLSGPNHPRPHLGNPARTVLPCGRRIPQRAVQRGGILLLPIVFASVSSSRSASSDMVPRIRQMRGFRMAVAHRQKLTSDFNSAVSNTSQHRMLMLVRGTLRCAKHHATTKHSRS